MADSATTPTRRLASYVDVDGVWYGPNDVVPDDVARKIRNPKAWASDEASDEETEPGKRPGTTSGARLAAYVDVDGTAYGPGDPIPDHVARKIRNPKAWADGKIPAEGTDASTPAPAATGSGADTGTTGAGAGVTPTSGTGTAGAQDPDPGPEGPDGTSDGNDGTTTTGGDTPPVPAKAARAGRGGGRVS